MSYHKLDRYQGRDGDSEYLRLTRQIPNNIVNISRNTKQLQKIVKVIGTPKESQQSMGQIRHIVRDTNSLIKMTKQMVSDVSTLTQSAENQSVEQVHEIFQDVAVMVQDQGEVLENIEANMQVTYDRVDRGVGELTHASRYQKSARNKAMCLLVIVVIVAGILAAILVPTLKKK
ncbi:hypothetical protein PTSG_07505 [Salpingoeca rosetta]|uniref:t-SNARE coiled-coil homology domain-containing protein n=1 Tax=Salpingoeca rosetta (strain ATCC 50818 / BSB-021) TaxID=946362 RepID=F2UIX3_SALR5|nr:uncharacterized protein PTSG_07505 [Salpingoeca rosetta]EGD77172.1 hypothetical protein PTSG_07505 [Salpingoeca rosetta]|eukprot:XP_004991011.1 hypothetical protein PTSG_07505 [Salpingoeca rosetta]